MDGRRAVTAMAALLAAAALVMGWRFLGGIGAPPGEPPPDAAPVHEGSVTSLHSPQTPQQIAAMMGGRVRLVWLRARDWRAVRRPGARMRIDTERFAVTLATPSRDPDLLEPPACIDGGGKDADLPGIGRWVDRRGAFAIMALDSDEGRERELVPTARLYNPLIMPDGQHVVFSSDDPASGAWSISMVGWDGTGARVVAAGFALWTWSDPATGAQWIYGYDHGVGGRGVWRIRPEQPAARQAVYAGEASHWFSLSHDGRRASGCFPWPVVGLLDVDSGRLDTRGYFEGCNAYIAPDDSYRIAVLNGAHNAVTTYAPGQPGIEASLIPPLMKRTQLGTPGKMWNPKWAGDARHVLVCGPIRPTTVDAAEVWLGAYASDYHAIRRWIQVTHSDCFDVSAHLWRDPGLGDRRGTAPLTIALDGLAPGSWSIDFGDGGQGGAAATAHTYARPGVYAISARRGAELRTGSVTVEASQPPLAASAVRRGAHEVEIRFARPLAGAGVSVLSPGGVPAAQLAAGSDGLRVFCSFAEAIRPPCTLTVRTDQAGSEAAGGGGASAVAVAAEPWPADPADLAFAWANARRDNRWYCAGRFVDTALIRHGAAHLDRDGALLLAGGSFAAQLGEGVAPWAGPDQGGPPAALSLEATIRLRDGAATAGHAAIIVLGPPAADGSALAVERSGGELSLAMGGQRLAIGRIADRARHHLAISCHDSTAQAFLDGEATGELAIPGAALPGRGRLELSGGGWQGTIEGIAVYRRALAQSEIASSRSAYAGLVAGSRDAPITRIHAQLSARSLIPTLGEIRPYRDALVVCEYDTNPENSTPGTRLLVAQWGIVDGVRTPLAGLEIGSACDLELEDIADHPELESAWLADTLEHLPSATLFVESGR